MDLLPLYPLGFPQSDSLDTALVRAVYNITLNGQFPPVPEWLVYLYLLFLLLQLYALTYGACLLFNSLRRWHKNKPSTTKAV